MYYVLSNASRIYLHFGFLSTHCYCGGISVYMIHAAWYMIHATWYMIHATWHMLHATWYLLLDTWYFILDAKYLQCSWVDRFCIFFLNCCFECRSKVTISSGNAFMKFRLEKKICHAIIRITMIKQFIITNVIIKNIFAKVRS